MVTEQRTCAWDECSETFTWRSSHPRQECCCPSHSKKRRWREDHPPLPGESLPEGQKRCRRCNRVRDRSCFSASQQTGAGWCRDCRYDYEKEWREANRDRRRLTARMSKIRVRLRRYGAPSEDFDELLEEQGGGCACCGGPAGAKGFHIDHDHNKPENESYRGLLCHGCNVGLGGFADDPGRLRQAIAYLVRTGSVPQE